MNDEEEVAADQPAGDTSDDGEAPRRPDRGRAQPLQRLLSHEDLRAVTKRREVALQKLLKRQKEAGERSAEAAPDPAG
jgi:hypothetical protein